jgi:hypothetical protein
VFLVLLRIVNSPFGRVLQAIRENDFRAEALGFRTVTYRTVSTVLAALFATVAGALLALWLRYTGPDTTLSFEIMLDILLIVVIGGMGTLYGAVMRSGRIAASPTDTGLQEIRSQRRGSHPRRHRGQSSQGHGQLFLAVGLVLELASEVLLVGRHVEMAVTTEVEEDGLALAFALAAHGFLEQVLGGSAHAG